MPQTETVGDEDADVFVDIGALFHLARRSEVVGPEVVSAWLDGDDALDDLTVERAGKLGNLLLVGVRTATAHRR